MLDVAGQQNVLHCISRLSRLSRAQCEPAFICEEHRAPVANFANLGVLWQMPNVLHGCKHHPHLWTLGPHTTLMESVSDRLSRHMHICGLLEVILQGSGSAPAPQMRRQRSCCWVVALLRPPPRLLMYWPVSWYRLHALDTTLTDTANLLATARIDVPSWMSCTT